MTGVCAVRAYKSGAALSFGFSVAGNEPLRLLARACAHTHDFSGGDIDPGV